MGIVDKIREKIYLHKSNKLLKQVEDDYNSAETKQEAIDVASKKAIEAIKVHPENETGAIEIISSLQESGLPKDVRINTVVQMSTTDEIEKSDKIVKEVVEKLNFSSEEIQKILREAGDYISINAAKEMIGQIQNPKIREIEYERILKLEEKRNEEKLQKKKQKENRIKEFLEKRYNDLNEIPISKLIAEMSEIRSRNKSEEIKQIMKRILAKKAAITCRTLGNAPIGTMMKIISAEEMMQKVPTRISTGEKKEQNQIINLNFIELIEHEYEKIKDDKNLKIMNKDYTFDRKVLEQMVLSRMAQDIAKTYIEAGIINIPQSETMKGLSKEQEEFFIEQIQTYIDAYKKREGEEIKNPDIEKIRKRIRGNQTHEDEELLELIRKIPEEEREDYLQELIRRIKRGRSRAQLDNEIETEMDRLRDGLKNLSVEEGMQVLDKAREEIFAIEKEKEKELQQKKGSTQNDDDSRTL